MPADALQHSVSEPEERQPADEPYPVPDQGLRHYPAAHSGYPLAVRRGQTLPGGDPCERYHQCPVSRRGRLPLLCLVSVCAGNTGLYYHAKAADPGDDTGAGIHCAQPDLHQDGMDLHHLI